MVTAQQVKELRDRTGVGMGDCKNALVEANGDMEMAIEILRKKGLSKAAKRAGNETSEGKIKVVTEGTSTYVVVVSCETDFVARNETFEEMLTKFIDIRKSSATDEEALVKAEELKAGEYTMKVGENLQIRTLTKIEGDVIASYVHSNFKNGSIVVAKAWTDADKLKQVAMHATATNPEYLSPNDVPTDVVEKEKSIQLEMMQADPKMTGKPQQVLDNILAGKLAKFKDEASLLEQQFVINPDIKVKDFIGADTIVKFYRYAI
jgi:elongation factor Ts